MIKCFECIEKAKDTPLSSKHFSQVANLICGSCSKQFKTILTEKLNDYININKNNSNEILKRELNNYFKKIKTNIWS